MVSFNDAWLAKPPRAKSAELWRGVEAQHVVSTMRLVDTLAEQRLLEELLEESKPAVPAAALPGRRDTHYLLFTPFRYRSPIASRFRRPQDPGVWYGAEDLGTACAEVAYWRWRFLMDSEALREEALLTQHSFFRARASGPCIDLGAPPWKSLGLLKNPDNYGECQALAIRARDLNVAWIRHQSARRAAGHCGAVLHVGALTLVRPFQPQTWTCKTTRTGVIFGRALHPDTYEFPAAAWQYTGRQPHSGRNP